MWLLALTNIVYDFFESLGDKYILKMRFMDHVYDDQVVDDLQVKIILPEGARYVP